MTTSFLKYLSFSILTLAIACKEEVTFDVVAQFEKDVATIQNHITNHHITAEKIGESGIYIERQYIDSTHLEQLNFSRWDDSLSFVTIAYKGYLIDGTIFDQTPPDSTLSYPLESFITGWQIGITQMTIGDTATLFIPSYHGYGNYSPSDKIPYNAILIFDIYLKSFENKPYYSN